MNKWGKAFLVMEIGVCFALAFLNLVVGILFAPAQILQLPHYGAVLWLLLCAGGVLGTLALFHVVRKIFQPAAKAPSPKFVWLMLAAGVAALTHFLINSIDNGISLMEFMAFGLPLACTMHLVYLGRRYLFGKILSGA